MPFRRTIHAAIEMHGKIYAVNEERMLCYDPDSDEWTLKASNEHRNGVSCMFKSGQFLYTIERTVAQRIYQYNPANNVWTMVRFGTLTMCDRIHSKIITKSHFAYF